jgi:hypothetical protein
MTAAEAVDGQSDLADVIEMEPPFFDEKGRLVVSRLAEVIAQAGHLRVGTDGRLWQYRAGVYRPDGELFARGQVRVLLGEVPPGLRRGGCVVAAHSRAEHQRRAAARDPQRRQRDAVLEDGRVATSQSADTFHHPDPRELEPRLLLSCGPAVPHRRPARRCGGVRARSDRLRAPAGEPVGQGGARGRRRGATARRCC